MNSEPSLFGTRLKKKELYRYQGKGCKMEKTAVSQSIFIQKMFYPNIFKRNYIFSKAQKNVMKGHT